MGILKLIGGFVIVLIAALFLGWATSPDPKFNPASFEDEPLELEIAALDQAVTLAQFEADQGSVITMAVLDYRDGKVSGVDLTELGGASSPDPLAALATADLDRIASEIGTYPIIYIAPSELLPSAPAGSRHIGTGTNFPEHAEEANSTSVFQFPKFGTATPSRTSIAARDEILLDYEVELCMRFDRDVASLEDFDAAVKGLFLCGDFTNRNALVEMADPDNLDSGFGFSDAKSGPGHFPSGPFLVVPRDWESFTDQLRMTTEVNGEPRQDARGGEMTLNFRQLTQKALEDMAEPRFSYQGVFVRLAATPMIDRSMTLMSGTSEGVIFTEPSRGDYVEILVKYLLAGGPLSEGGLMGVARPTIIANELDGGHFLQPGDRVRHASNYLGDIEVKVTTDAP